MAGLDPAIQGSLVKRLNLQSLDGRLGGRPWSGLALLGET